MQLLPKIFRAGDPHLGILQTILAGFRAAQPVETIRAVFSSPVMTPQGQVERLGQAAIVLGCEVGPMGVSAEYILAANHPTVILVQPQANNPPYTVTVWNKIGSLYQILDPFIGRRWLTADGLREELIISPIAQDAETCGQMLQHPTQTALLRTRMSTLGVDEETTTETASRGT